MTESTAPTEHSAAPTREKLAELLARLRGDVPVAEVARRLPAGAGSSADHASRQSVMELERGWHLRRTVKNGPEEWHIANPTLARLEELGEVYGVNFELVARDPQTNAVVFKDAPGLRQPRSTE